METTPTTPGSVGEQFRPIVLLLCSHTPDNIDATAVARQLQPRFRSGDFYIVSAAGTGDAAAAPNEGRKTRSSDALAHPAAANPQDRLSSTVQAALAKIAAARREARQAAEDAKAAQLAALKADYLEDGLSAEEALAAAQAELNGRSGSDNDDGGSLDDADNEAAGTGRLPPCVCVLHVPLSVADVSRLARDVAGVAAVLLLEAACPIRELAGAPAAAGRKSSFVSAAVHPPGDRGKGRGAAAGGAAAANASGAGKQQQLQQQLGAAVLGGGSAEDVVAAFNRAIAGQQREAAVQNVLVHRVAYPTEGTGAGTADTAVFRPSVPAAQFLSTVHGLVLRVLGSWVRYDTWRARRALVQVPPYTPLVDVDAAALAAITDEAAAAAAAASERRPSKRKSGGAAGGGSGREESIPADTTADPPTTPAQPRRMDEVAAEQFEYRAFMQRWCAAAGARAVAGAAAADNPIAAAPAVQACLCACVCQVSSLQGPSTLRGAADTSAAQLSEDVRAACALCRTTIATAVGAAAPACPADHAAAEESGITAPLECVADPVTPAPALDAPSVEAALADVVGACAGAAALPAVSTALTTSPGAGDALHWLGAAVVPRDQQGWGVAVRRWADSVFLCLRQPAAVEDGVPRTQHTTHLLDCPTTFPRYFAEEDFLEAEDRHYAPSSIADDDTEEEEDEEEEGGEESTDGSASEQQSDDSDFAGTATVTTQPTPTPRIALPPAGPVVDHVDVIAQQLRRRRVLEQVRLYHTRPPVQELLCGPAPCRAVATETQWMEAKDGTVIEVARTAANGAQVGCRIRDADARVEAGFLLECPPASCPQAGTASGTCVGDVSPAAALPESMVASGVRGYLCVGQHLRVMTQVVADNERAVAQAAHAAAVAAAKEAAVAQYEAQFSRGGKATKSRDKAAPASQLTLEQITESLLAALPPLPAAADSPTAAGAAAAPPVMQVHASFPPYDCVMTATASRAGVPGVRVRCLPPSRFSEPLPHRSCLLTVQLWCGGELTSVAVRTLRGVVVYLDGVAEVHSPDLPPGVRVLLHRDGSYVAATERARLLVAASGRCTLCEGVERGRVVRQLQAGLATAVTAPEVRRVEREDGHQLELLCDGDAETEKRPSLTPSPLGRVRSIRFGPGAAVEQGAVTGEWRWRFDRVPVVYCDAAAAELALAVDEENGDGERFAYQPHSESFALLRRGASNDGRASADVRVAASFALRSCRLALFTDHSGSSGGAGVFAVDCAYGGAVGRVGETHVYRVSPFGRCFEESLVPAEPRPCQLVLPATYKRPRRRPAEALLLTELASPSFHRAVAGVGEDGDVCPTVAGAPVEPLHVNATAATQLPCREASHTAATPSPSAASYNALVAPLRVPGSAATPAGIKVRCVAVHPGGPQQVVLDGASWAAWVQWWRRHGSWRAEVTGGESTSDGGAPQRITFRLMRRPSPSRALVPLTEAGAELPPPPPSTVQTCVLLPPPAEALPTPQWCTAGFLAQSLAGGVPAVAAAGASAEVPTSETSLTMSGAAAPRAPEAQAGAPVAGAPVDAASAPASAPRRSRGGGGPLRYWTSRLAPSPGPETPARASPTAAAADDQSHSPAARAQTATPPTAVAGAVAAAAAPAATAVEGAKASLSATGAAAKSLTGSAHASKVPLMRSYRPATDAFTGTNASSRYHTPLLSVQPQQIEFGNVLHGRRYVATVRVTNTSTVPCRYRVRIAAALRPYLSAAYSRQFVAPGITTEVTIELAGSQPYGVTDSDIAVVHEGGAVEVGVWWCTTDESHAEQLGDGIECAGWMLQKPELQHPYQPPTEEEREQRQAEHGALSDSDAALDVPAL